MIVAGAGVIGLSCAWRLAQTGLEVTLFDAREAAAEASWAGAGMLAPGGEVDRHSEVASLAARSLNLYPEFVEELRDTTGLSIDFQRCGAFELAMTEEESKALGVKAERQHALGIESESCRYGEFDARFYPGDAIVDPRQLAAALRSACLRLGVTLREHEPVVEVAPDGAWIRTARENLSAPNGVLIAAGAWSSELCFTLPRTKPIRGHLLSWNLEPGSLPSILRHGHTYLLQRSSGTLIAGSSTEDVGFDRAIDGSIVADIRQRAATLLPVIAGLEPQACWNGFRPVIDAGGGMACAPLIGKVGSRLWAAFGHYRNGILLAPETARLIGSSVAGDSNY